MVVLACTFCCHGYLQLAEGLEKSRSESSLIVWDVTRTSADTPTPISASRSVPSPSGRAL